MTKSTGSSVGLTVQRVRFLCEQRGPIETALKEQLSKLFGSGSLIRRAYLVRVAYEDSVTTTSVALALRTGTDQDETGLVGPVGALFAALFGSHEHLDILFIREEREGAIREICPAFYEAPAQAEVVH